MYKFPILPGVSTPLQCPSACTCCSALQLHVCKCMLLQMLLPHHMRYSNSELIEFCSRDLYAITLLYMSRNTIDCICVSALLPPVATWAGHCTCKDVLTSHVLVATLSVSDLLCSEASHIKGLLSAGNSATQQGGGKEWDSHEDCLSIRQRLPVLSESSCNSTSTLCCWRFIVPRCSRL